MTLAVQISKKLPDGTIVVLGGEDFDKFVSNTIAVYEGSAEHADALLQKVRDAFAGTVDMTGAASTNLADAFQQAAPVQQQRPSAGPAPASGRTCLHGPMTFRTGTSAKGPWSAYFCPAQKGDPTQCQPQFLRSK